MRYKTAVVLSAIIPLSLILHCMLNPIGGTDTGNPNIAGVLYNKDGSRAKNAKVRVIPSDYNPRNGSSALMRFDSTITDDTGGYYFDSLPADTYNVFGSGEKGVSYQDSIAVVQDAKIRIPSDTLKAPGSLQGVVRLQPGDDCRTVFVIMMGTTMWTMPVDSLGNFSLSNCAEGDYHVRVITTLDQYQPMDMVITVLSGKNKVLSDTIVQKYTGIPIPTGVRLVYDTLKQLVTLIWDKADPTLVKGYCVYQSNVDLNTTFEQIHQSLITATTFTDSFTLANTTYSYKICAVDNGDNKGRLSAGVTVSIVPLRAPRITGEPAENQMVPLDSTLSLTVSATGETPLTYAWYKNRIDSMTLITAAQDDSTFWIGNVRISDSGYYFCVVSNVYGSDTSRVLHVMVDITDCKPRITSVFRNDTVMAGYQLKLAISATCTMPFSYAWYKNGNDPTIIGQNDSILVIDSIRMSDSGYYFCVVSNDCGADTIAALITVIESSNIPIITSHPGNTTVYASTQAQMKIVAFGAGVLSYAWYKNTVSAGTVVTDQTSATLTIASVQVADSGNYLCVVTNAYGSDTSNPGRLTVNNGRPLITVQPRDTAVLETLPWSMSVTAAGAGTMSYAWYKTGNAAVRGTNSILSISAAAMTDAGTYYCVVANTFGACTSSVARLSVSPNKQIYNPIMLTGAFIDSTHVLLSVKRYSGLVALVPDQFFPWSPDTVQIWYRSGSYPTATAVNQVKLTISKVRLQEAGGDQFDTLVTVLPIGCQSYYFKGSVKWMNTSVTDDSIPPLGDNTTGAAVVMCETSSSLILRPTGITATQVTLAWTNSGSPYDSFRIWYATMPIPDTNPSPSVFSSQGIAGTAVTAVIRNLKELTTYYFGIQGARAGIWSYIPAAAKTSATTQKDTALAIPNTMKILDVIYDTATFKIKVTYRIDPLGFQHRVGFSWLQQSQGVPPLPTEFAEPVSSPRVGEITYTDSPGKTTIYEFDMAKASPALDYGTEYYFGGWVSKIGEKWTQPTDSSIFYYAIPQPKAVPAVLFRNTDTVTAFNGQLPYAQDSGRKP